MDTTLDCVPVRQPRNEKTQEKFVPTNLFPTKVDVTNIPTKPSPLELPSVNLDKVSIPAKSYAQMAAPKTVNQNTSKKIFSSSKPTDILLKNLQSSLRLVSEDTECSMDSLSISKIAEFLGIAFKIIVVYYVIYM